MAIINQVVSGGGSPAPAKYIAKDVDANGSLIPGNILIDLTGVTDLPAEGLYRAYSAGKPNSIYTDPDPIYNYPAFNNVDIDLSGMTLGSASIHQAFYGRKGINNVKIGVPNPTNISYGNLTFAFSDAKTAIMYGVQLYNTIGTFYKDTYLTSLSCPDLTTVTNNSFSEMCTGDTSLVTVDMPKLKTIGSTSSYDACFKSAFSGCTSLETIDLNNVETITSGYDATPMAFTYAFRDCSALRYVGLDKLKSINGSYSYARNACYGMFMGCVSLVTQKFKSLTSVYGAGAYLFQNCTALEEVWFYALTQLTNKYGLYQMFQGCSNVTVHFPKAQQATWETYDQFVAGFGGTNTTVLFDIITTLTGADTNAYTRQEKDSTTTATAWVNNNVLYYTSGTNEPAVGDTIYSDAACTTAVTTISAIA